MNGLGGRGVEIFSRGMRMMVESGGGVVHVRGQDLGFNLSWTHMKGMSTSLSLRLRLGLRNRGGALRPRGGDDGVVVTMMG